MMNAIRPPRYLVSFRPKRITHRFTDALVLGSGLAGLRCALEIDPRHRVLLVTKESFIQSNSNYAQGGIAAVWNSDDRFELHVGDTIEAGKGLCDPTIVELVVREAPQRIRDLIEWGAVFDRQDGELALGREGGHSVSRILHALGDATGREVVRAALDKVRSSPNIDAFENTFVIDLLTIDDHCVGALTWTDAAGIQAIWSKQTVLATGGCGQIYRETTNPLVATGDGMAIAYRAGAILRDMEFVQFHPTVLYVAGSNRTLISEAVRGEGAYLRDKNGERFMLAYSPMAELAPRDIVSKSIVTQMAKTQHPCVYLDLSHLNAEQVRRRFPGITSACAQYGLDFGRDLIPVRPGAHYMVGGVATDSYGRSSVDGLWACGEAAATGLHGANRLASNSLLEALVFGQMCGEGINRILDDLDDDLRAHHIEHEAREAKPPELDLSDVRNSLRSLMSRDVGIERTAQGLESARDAVDFWCQYVLSRELPGPEGWELQNMLTVAGLVIAAALERTESRGTHQRSDFPQTDDANWKTHLVAGRDLTPNIRREPLSLTTAPARG